jgi:hypothetical protein
VLCLYECGEKVYNEKIRAARFNRTWLVGPEGAAAGGTAKQETSAAVKAPQPDPKTDWQRSRPDVLVYLPKGEEHHDTDNEHFLVFEAPGGKELVALWNQSSVEGRGDNRVMTARSTNGIAWSEPQFVCGTRPGTKMPQASWPFPIITKSGRIYCFYTRQMPLNDGNPQGSGAMGCCYSDDGGRSWVSGSNVPMRRNRFDNPNPEVPRNWIVWQIPIRDRNGRPIAGYTQVTSAALQPPALKKKWYQWESRCQFMRFENIDEDPAPENIRVTWLPDDEAGLEVPHPNTGRTSVSEPSVVVLPDGRLFATMRTWTGQIWFSVSDDDGQTWRKPDVLRYQDEGEPVLHPLAPCPIYRLRDRRFLLVFHNNNGRFDGHDQLRRDWKSNELNFIRHPAFIAVGEFRPARRQPVWFSRPRQILDTGGVPIGPKGTSEIATYTSLTEWRGQRMLWYPDRKYYLLGKSLPNRLLEDMTVPSR